MIIGQPDDEDTRLHLMYQSYCLSKGNEFLYQSRK